MILFLSEI